MTARKRTGKKRYFCYPHSGGWFVERKGSGEDVASFFGRYARTFARAHAKMLNGLKREEQP